MKIALIVPYFGKFPNYFQIVLNSCEKNADQYDWLFFTDDRTEYTYPVNVKVFYSSFIEIKSFIQSKFDFEISLERPYKFCDYKPMYGYIFSEYLKEYDFWGHCDIDCIYGKFSNFFTEEAFKFDRIMRLGHLTMYKNTEKNNKRFMNSVQGILRYKEVMQTNSSCIFDESNCIGELNIEDIWNEYGYSNYLNDNCIANTGYKNCCFKLHFQIGTAKYKFEKTIRSIFYWNEGSLIRLYIENGELLTKEFAYIHLMGRKMKNLVPGNYKGKIKIIPNAFQAVNNIPRTVNEFKKERWKNFNIQYIRMRTKNLKTKILRRINKYKKQ